MTMATWDDNLTGLMDKISKQPGDIMISILQPGMSVTIKVPKIEAIIEEVIIGRCGAVTYRVEYWIDADRTRIIVYEDDIEAIKKKETKIGFKK